MMISRAAFKFTANSARSKLFVIATSIIRKDKADKDSHYSNNVVLEADHDFIPLFTKTEGS